jgi:hypothetical protein
MELNQDTGTRSKFKPVISHKSIPLSEYAWWHTAMWTHLIIWWICILSQMTLLGLCFLCYNIKQYHHIYQTMSNGSFLNRRVLSSYGGVDHQLQQANIYPAS